MTDTVLSWAKAQSACTLINVIRGGREEWECEQLFETVWWQVGK